MEHEFDYSNIPENPVPEMPQAVPQPQETVQETVQEPYYEYTYPQPQSQPVPQPQPQPVPQPENEKKKRTGRAWTIILSIVAAVLILVNVAMLASNARLQDALQNQINQNTAQEDRIAQLEKALAGQGGVISIPGQVQVTGDLLTPQQVYAMNVNAVVAINSQSVQTNIYGQVSKTASVGSGFIISEDGYVVTNYHVIEGGTKVSVITYDEREHPATVVGHDEINDVALLKIEGSFSCVTIGSSDELQVGDQVMAIGNPLGELTSTLTVGYVSAKDRMVSTDGTAINMLQTDAAINSGNSGGPLFNAKGELVGINTAKYSGTSASGASIEGIGFAIPIDDVLGILDDLQNKGFVSSAYLGVYVREVDASAQSYGVPAGAHVEETVEGYCAREAGIQPQDIIIAVGEYKVDSLSALNRALRRFEAGDRTTVTVWRAGVEVKLDITLDEKPLDVPASAPEQETEPETQPQDDGYDFEDFLDRFFGNG